MNTKDYVPVVFGLGPVFNNHLQFVNGFSSGKFTETPDFIHLLTILSPC